MNDARAGVLLKERFRQQAHDIVAFNELTLLIKEKAAVKVAVPGQPQSGFVLEHSLARGFASFGKQRVGDAIGEGAVRLVLDADELFVYPQMDRLALPDVAARLDEEGAAALQSFVEDFLPLILLFAVSLTGLMLTASYTWMHGYAYDFLAILHAVTVIFTFLWLPFGKFFHIFQRPAQIAVRFYKEVGRDEEPEHCARCGHGFTSRMHAQDLIDVERRLGFDYRIDRTNGGVTDHYQRVCPPCRRALVAAAQGAAWRGVRGGVLVAAGAAPAHVNPGLGEGPLGRDDAENFHG